MGPQPFRPETVLEPAPLANICVSKAAIRLMAIVALLLHGLPLLQHAGVSTPGFVVPVPIAQGATAPVHYEEVINPGMPVPFSHVASI